MARWFQATGRRWTTVATVPSVFRTSGPITPTSGMPSSPRPPGAARRHAPECRCSRASTCRPRATRRATVVAAGKGPGSGPFDQSNSWKRVPQPSRLTRGRGVVDEITSASSGPRPERTLCRQRAARSAVFQFTMTMEEIHWGSRGERSDVRKRRAGCSDLAGMKRRSRAPGCLCRRRAWHPQPSAPAADHGTGTARTAQIPQVHGGRGDRDAESREGPGMARALPLVPEGPLRNGPRPRAAQKQPRPAGRARAARSAPAVHQPENCPCCPTSHDGLLPVAQPDAENRGGARTSGRCRTRRSGCGCRPIAARKVKIVETKTWLRASWSRRDR